MAKNQIDFSPTNPENAAAGATAAAETPVVDTTDDDEVQVDVGPVEETPAEVVTLTPEEFAALKSSSDSAKAVKEGIEGLASQLRTPAPVQLPAQRPPADRQRNILPSIRTRYSTKKRALPSLQSIRR